MLNVVNKYARNYSFSQNGEEGVLEECFRRMGVTAGSSVEAGAADGTFCSNTALLLERGWAGLMVESEWPLYLKCRDRWLSYPMVRCQCSRVDAHNINAFVKSDCDLLSLDLDGPDYAVFLGLKAKPKIVIVEIDSSLDPSYSHFNAEGGANYFAMVALGITKGYFLLCHTGNLIFLREEYRELFPEITGHPLVDIEQYFNRSWLKEEAA